MLLVHSQIVFFISMSPRVLRTFLQTRDSPEATSLVRFLPIDVGICGITAQFLQCHCSIYVSKKSPNVMGLSDSLRGEVDMGFVLVSISGHDLPSFYTYDRVNMVDISCLFFLDRLVA